MDIRTYYIIIVSLLGTGYLLYLIIEKILIKKYRESFKHVILINGTNDKIKTLKMVDFLIRNNYKTFSYYSSNKPKYINTKGEVLEFKRLGFASFRDYERIIKMAYKEKAEILIVECLIIDKKYQKILNNHILKSDITIITDIKDKSNYEININDLAIGYSYTIPKKGLLITSESRYNRYFDRIANLNETKSIIISDKKTLNNNVNNVYINDILINYLNIKITLNNKEKNDITEALEVNNKSNDRYIDNLDKNNERIIKSFYKLLNKVNKNDITILLNNDNQNSKLIINNIKVIKEIKPKKIIISGTNKAHTKFLILKNNKEIEIEYLNDIKDLKKENFLFIIGTKNTLANRILESLKNKKEDN